MSDPFQDPGVRELIRRALAEDLGRGDVTTAATIPRGRNAFARIDAREDVIVAGLPIAQVVFAERGAAIDIALEARDGERAPAGRTLMSLTGSAHALLEVERTLLNFLQRLCGVATQTRRFTDAVAGTAARIVDTRKTIPGWRLLDKYAVRVGGAANHRFGLDDGILIKDNHIAAAGGITRAVTAARAAAPHLLKIEVECETLTDVDEALAAGADAILLDNMSLENMAAAVQRVKARVPVEASGGITLERVREVAATGVDLISVGALTHSAPAADLSMELSPSNV